MTYASIYAYLLNCQLVFYPAKSKLNLLYLLEVIDAVHFMRE